MPFNMQREAKVKNATQRPLRTSGRKAPGTRVGVLFDWRSGSATSGRPAGRYGRALRDGK
ncbi:MAG TPA: hypothetical protein VFD75_11110 [Pyrinomonadaceae bacterium]|nr:hypothetical protein [Pyrinomonadaceae bacterium]